MPNIIFNEKYLKNHLCRQVYSYLCFVLFQQENLVGLLDYLGPIKAKHAALSTQVKEMAAAHRESMDSIRGQLDGTLQLLQHFQQTDNSKASVP